MTWTSSGYKPDIVVMNSGPHSVFKRRAADSYKASLWAVESAVWAWHKAFVRISARHCIAASESQGQDVAHLPMLIASVLINLTL